MSISTPRRAAFRRHAFLTLVLFAASSGCVGGDASGGDVDGDGKTDVYGSDDRREPWQAEELYRRLAESTAVVVTNRSLDTTGGATSLYPRSLGDKMEAELGAPLCDGELFVDQPAPGWCSAFLIAPDLVATAGHCINTNRRCGETRFVFGFAYDRSSSEADVLRVDANDLYRCDTVVGHLFNPDATTLDDIVNSRMYSDWAVVRLDRPVLGRQPLRLRRSGAVENGDRVVALGYPGGVPLKITYGRAVDVDHELFFNTDLDIYSGNSGSVVVGVEGLAEGIAVRGTGGTSYVPDGACFASRYCDAWDPSPGSQCHGNQVQRIEPLLQFTDAEQILRVGHLVDDGAIPDGSGEVTDDLYFDSYGTIRFVTLNATIVHYDIRDLQISLERVETGERSVVFSSPRLHPDGEAIFSRTVSDFDGEEAHGTWRIHVEDGTANGGTSQQLWVWQLVIGIGDPVAPAGGATFIGTPCADDAGCTFDETARCHTWADGGFCTVGCEGTCPDRAGFATTFCTSLDGGASGRCVSRAHAANGYCAELPGTVSQSADRFIGSSSAAPARADVCLP